MSQSTVHTILCVCVCACARENGETFFLRTVQISQKNGRGGLVTGRVYFSKMYFVSVLFAKCTHLPSFASSFLSIKEDILNVTLFGVVKQDKSDQ